MKSAIVLGLLLLAGCSQSYAQVIKPDVSADIVKMSEACHNAGGAYQIQQFTIPDGTTKFQFICTNVPQPAPKPQPDTNKVQA